MAAVQEPEVQFAQRLASNEKPIRTRAMKKLRKYISVRSQRDTGGFTGDELLKLWKGLFYCLWMQDKPLLQEELSNQISSLLHNFQTADGQFLYLESFLQTFKREWTGIDRLRMDKFFQLVRFMFRQTFEMLKRKNWDSSLVSSFLELLTAQLLHSSSEAPSGLQFHVLDLYMTELAAVGSQELTADQNLNFIEPFCKTAAKTKDGILFRAICNSIFSTIIDQAPFAIDDLMKELKAAEASDSDSGQASEEEEEEDEEEQLKEKTVSKAASKKRTGKQINGKKSNDDEDEDDYDDDDDEDDDDDDELLHLEDSDTEAPGGDDVGPVLQFDYAALADRLFELASRSNTPSQNRQRLYKIIKVLRDLSEGIFPQDEYPEEVSTDEDDDSFGSRKRMKRRGRRTEEDEEGTPASKKRKKKEAAALDKQDEDSAKDDSEPADLTANTENKKKKRKKKKKKKKAEQGGGEGGENAEQEQMVIKETEVSQTQSSVSSVKVTQAATPDGQPETLLVSEVKKQPSVTVTEETSQTPAEVSSDAADAALAGKKKKKKKRAGQAGGEGGENTETSEQTQSSVSSVKVTEAEDPPITEETSQPTPEEQSEKVEPAGEQQMAAEVSSDSDVAVSGKKKKNKKKKKGLKLQTDVAESQVSAEAEPIKSEELTPATDVTTPAKKKKSLNVEKTLEETEAESQVNGVNTDASVPSKPEDSAEDGPTSGLETQTDSATPAKKKSKNKNLKTDEAAKVEAEAEIPSAGEDAATTPLKKKTKKKDKQEDTTLEAPPAADESCATPLKKKKRKNNLKESVEEDGAAADAVEPSVAMTTPAKKKKKKPAAAKMGEIKDQNDSEVVSSSGKVAKKKKRKIPIVFEYEADELEAAASINGLAEEEETAVKKTKLDGGEPSTPLSTKKSQKKAKTPSGATSDFITFQSNAAVPTPLFCKTKGGLSTPRSGKKKNQTPKSESKKVTFGLKNNKTAEFRKTDRSLLVSPDGSSRVPFDPKQKPKFGVLKSPATPLSTGAKKTPKGPKKSGSGTPKSTPKRRPSAADFF